MQPLRSCNQFSHDLGIPDTIVADNMPFNSAEFKDFSRAWSFDIITSSPNFPQSNGLVERNVQTIKRVIRKAKESNASVDLALLEYRNTLLKTLMKCLRC